MAKSIVKLCEFIHVTQCERGLSALYLRNRKAGDLLQFQDHIHKTETIWKSIADMVNDLDHLCQVNEDLPALKEIRGRVMQGDADLSETIHFYSTRIIGPALDAVATLASTDPANDAARVSAFINLLHWKERVGQERALGILMIEGSKIQNDNGRLSHLIAEMSGYGRMFLALADESLRQHYEQTVASKPAFRQIAKIEEAVSRGGSAKALSNVSAEDWFDLLSAKMDFLQILVVQFIDHLPADPGTLETRENTGLSTGIVARLEDLKDLPLLRGLNSDCLLALLQEAKLATYDRGALIFMQGDTADRFYVILDGWVKLLKSNIDGEESVIEVLTTGDGLSEVAIFRDSLFPVTAQTVEKAVLMSLPGPWVRARIKQDKDFAINMLAAAANRSKTLISQFEQLTLKNVTQRVGRFLLKQFLESGGERTELTLPLEKSVIAAYLGMKPETFSRTLQSLRAEGIAIEKNIVTLPDALALCSYCDMELAGRCPRSNTDLCPDPDRAYS